MNQIAKIIETEAFKVASPKEPFWYTSGKIGPYFINTHFLYGAQKYADELLATIDSLVYQPENLIPTITEKVIEFYHSNSTYQTVMDSFVEILNASPHFNEASIISGGERRDWFFSIIAAKLSGKRHIFIMKNQGIYDEDGEIANLNQEKVSHIADLITEASSYERAWIPAIQKHNGNLIHTASIVDRQQGGCEFITNRGIYCESIIKIGREFFDAALAEKIISTEQHAMIVDFTHDPHSYGLTLQ